MAMQDSSKEYGDLFRGLALNISFNLMQKALCDFTQAEVLGLKPENLEAISKLSPLEVSQIVREISLDLVDLTVNTQSVQSVLESFFKNKRQQELISDLLKNGASNNQIKQWFSLSYRQLRELRKDLGYSLEAGKNKNLSEEEINQFSAEWLSQFTLNSGIDNKDALSCLVVSKNNGIPISYLDQLPIRK
ncbi:MULTISPECIES: STY4526/YPO1902 family pathogenicity island replication protein [Rosenbergiella]|uniref:STY4526/YPO1902 family pathogenicity island replication protein n=1 Tax=Rosenbergiella TaxID=1356488 RepID=UPI001F4FBD56|nr:MULTISPECIES: STY4526/YPO1902 family pathogenicity island replication protein [Rosenbergiella]